jgi:uncharacterized membrane protein YqgA involved in biofilm formation
MENVFSLSLLNSQFSIKKMLGTFANVAAIVVGSAIGLLIKSRLNPRYAKIFFQAAGLFTICIGLSMVVKTEHLMVVGVSLVLGALLGEWLRLHERLQNFGDWLKKKVRVRDEKFSEGLVTAFLLFCVGTMSILGPIEEGLTGKTSELLLTKSLMDGFSSLMFASALGIGVMFSAVPLLIFQGTITLLAMWLGSFIQAEIIVEVSAVGGALLIALGLHIMEVKDVKVVNMLPALVIAYALMLIMYS